MIASGSLFTELCHRDHRCPAMYRFLNYSHLSAVVAFNTGDETISAPILDFIRAR